MFYLHDKSVRLFYRSPDARDELLVTGTLFTPTTPLRVIDDLVFIGVQDGIYYCDITFSHIGKHALLIKENGKQKTFEVFKVA